MGGEDIKHKQEDENRMIQLSDICRAEGLEQGEDVLLLRLSTEHQRHIARNALKMAYYEDKNAIKNLSMAVPEKFLGTIDCSVGWCAKAVDMVAARSRFDSYTCADHDVASALSAIAADNDLSDLYSQAITSELVHGCGFWTVSAGDQSAGEQQVVINYRDALSASALYDYRTKGIKAGMVVEDYDYVSGSLSDLLEPSMVVLHTAENVVTIVRKDRKWAVADRQANPMGRPLMEPMGYRPRYGRFGKSRVTRTLMGITDEMQREIVRMALHSECFSAPQKYMLGAPEDMFDIEKMKMAYNSFMMVTDDPLTGARPTLGQFSQASMTPHLEVMRNLASRAAAEASIPVDSLGIIHDNPSSAEALRASMDNLIIEIESLNKTNGKALVNVARMALAIAGGKSIGELTDEERTLTVHWEDPANPSIAAMSDAMVKQAAVAPGLVDSDVFWERLGYQEDERRRIKADMRQGKMADALNSMFAASGGE